jgi:hypothetical protein
MAGEQGWRGQRRLAIAAAVLVTALPANVACAPVSGTPGADGSAGAAPPDGQAADVACKDVKSLEVTAEHEGGYDRDRFGEYDRDALLEASLDKHGDYYSAFDDTHHDDASDVEADHIVALAEAWESGAYKWDDKTLDKFAADKDNLVLLTAEVNTTKSDQDIAEWLPPHEPAVETYVAAWVSVKREYDLSVNQAELDTLLELTDCGT